MCFQKKKKYHWQFWKEKQNTKQKGLVVIYLYMLYIQLLFFSFLKFAYLFWKKNGTIILCLIWHSYWNLKLFKFIRNLIMCPDRLHDMFNFESWRRLILNKITNWISEPTEDNNRSKHFKLGFFYSISNYATQLIIIILMVKMRLIKQSFDFFLFMFWFLNFCLII